MSTEKSRLKTEIRSYEQAKDAFLISAAGKKLTDKLRKEKQKQNKTSTGLCCCCKRNKTDDPNEMRRRLQYYEDKITEAVAMACAEQLRNLKEITREIRENRSLQPKDKELQRAHRILYRDKYRKNLLFATESSIKEKLEKAIAKTYDREPLASDLHKELAQAERALEYVMRRERQRRGSTWKFQYDAQQAGYNLSYWVGDDQHWLRNKYRKYERRTSEDERIVENPIIERESEPDDTENNKLRSQLLKSLAEASTRREVTEIRSAILRINESRFKHDMKFEVTRAEQLIAELEKQPPEIGIDDRANKDDLNESDDSEELRERLHKAVWNETLDFVELRESADLFEAANLEDINGDLAKAHRMLQANIYVEGLRHGIEDRDLDVLETILGEIDFKQMKCEVGEIYDEAKNLIRKMTLERRNKNMALTLKRELARAMSNRNAPQIRNTLTNIRQAQLEQKLSDEVKAAERLLRELELETEELQKDMEEKNELERINKEVFRLQQLLQGAIDEGDISLLQSAIQSVIDSGLEDLLRSELSDANELLDKLKEKLAFRKSVAEIPARYVSEVRSYKNPPAGSLEVMQATFLLLGFDENNLKTWRDIQTHLGKGGTDSFRYRVVKRDTHVIDDHVVERAQDLLDEISLDDAQNLSLLVNLFYRYCQAVINESNPPNATNS